MDQTFTPGEAAYLAASQLGRLTTLTGDGAPTVVPVGFRTEPDGTIRIVGHQLGRSAKARNLRRDARCAFVVDDGIGETARGVLVRGTAEVAGGDDDAVIVLVPRSVTSWGIDTHPFTRQRRTV